MDPTNVEENAALVAALAGLGELLERVHAQQCQILRQHRRISDRLTRLETARGSAAPEPRAQHQQRRTTARWWDQARVISTHFVDGPDDDRPDRRLYELMRPLLPTGSSEVQYRPGRT